LVSPPVPNRGLVASERRLAWNHPEYAALGVSLLAWVLLLGIHAGGPGGHLTAGGMGSMPMPAGHQHSMPPSTTVAGERFWGSGLLSSGFWESSSGLPLWILMSAATMILATVPAIRHVGLNSLRRRRQRAITGFLLAYLLVWSAFGLVVLPLLDRLRPQVAHWQLVTVSATVAVLWQVLPPQVRFLRACHLTVPLPPRGRRALGGCLHFGVRHGLACVGVCGPLMLVMAVLLHADPVWMVLLSAIVVTVKLAPGRLPRFRTWSRNRAAVFAADLNR
jgi:predicted metal-binding membrane protein